MIISRGRNFIFVHIPKTGGTSMALALEDRAMKDDMMLGDTPKAVRRRKRLKQVAVAGRLWKHSTLADIEGLVTRDDIARMFTFTLVRNPWDRIASYYHWLRGQSFDHPAVHLAAQTSFAEFLNSAHLRASLAASPYASYMRDGSGTERCSLYIRIEKFAKDAAPLFDHLGFAVTLPLENASQRVRDYRMLYTDEMRQIVDSVCADDIARFGYSFDQPS
jgi:hypothetical protein